MNSNRQVEVHYINTGFPYTVTESFMDLFEGLSYAQADACLSGPSNDQGSPYWSMMHMNPYKYGFYSSGGISYYNYNQAYEINDYTLRLDGERNTLDSFTPLLQADTTQILLDGGGGADDNANIDLQECVRVNHPASSPQGIWQDNIDPDNMTYEELLDLGESVGTQSRGLSQERISSLPVSKYKCGFFSRKKSRRERCVICQMEYKRGDLQIVLPCNHAYHSICVSRWLGINKACPVCFAEVFGDEPKC